MRPAGPVAPPCETSTSHSSNNAISTNNAICVPMSSRRIISSLTCYQDLTAFESTDRDQDANNDYVQASHRIIAIGANGSARHIAEAVKLTPGTSSGCDCG